MKYYTLLILLIIPLIPTSYAVTNSADLLEKEERVIFLQWMRGHISDIDFIHLLMDIIPEITKNIPVLTFQNFNYTDSNMFLSMNEYIIGKKYIALEFTAENLHPTNNLHVDPNWNGGYILQNKTMYSPILFSLEFTELKKLKSSLPPGVRDTGFVIFEKPDVYEPFTVILTSYVDYWDKQILNFNVTSGIRK